MPKALEANDGIQQQQPPPHTEYMIMSVQANQIQTRYSILAGLFAWITLAGFITLPNTFTSIQTSNSLSGNEGGKMVQETVRNLQLLPFAGIICFIGIIGTCSLWRKKKCRENYIWLIRHLFLPGFSHSLIGLFSTLVNILTTQEGYVSVTAKVTLAIISVLCGITLCLCIVYNHLLSKIIILHDKEVLKYEEHLRCRT